VNSSDDQSNSTSTSSWWSSPIRRAHASGRFLARLGIGYGALLAVGSVVLFFVTEEGGCSDWTSWGGTDVCWEYETSRPFLPLAVSGLLSSLIVGSLLFAVGSHIESRATGVDPR